MIQLTDRLIYKGQQEQPWPAKGMLQMWELRRKQEKPVDEIALKELGVWFCVTILDLSHLSAGKEIRPIKKLNLMKFWVNATSYHQWTQKRCLLVWTMQEFPKITFTAISFVYWYLKWWWSLNRTPSPPIKQPENRTEVPIRVIFSNIKKSLNQWPSIFKRD